MSIALIKPELDVWEPGEHNGTFRGNNLAFVGATATLDYWADEAFTREIDMRVGIVDESLRALCRGSLAATATPVGRGLFRGLRFEKRNGAERMRMLLLESRVLAETCGPHGEVLKLMPAINIPEECLQQGLAALHACARYL